MNKISDPIAAVIVSIAKSINLNAYRYRANIAIYRTDPDIVEPSIWVADIRSASNGFLQVWTRGDTPQAVISSLNPADPNFSQKLADALMDSYFYD